MKKRLLSCLAFSLALVANSQIELFKDINPGNSDSGPNYAYVTNDGKKVYFQASNGTDGSELWVSDGTVDGTKQIINLDGTSDNSYPRAFVEYNNTMYFYNYGVKEMWKTDGTTNGTEIANELADQYFEDSVVLNNKLYFLDKNVGDTNYNILQFDGTTVSTTGYDNSNGTMYVSDMFVFDNKIFCYGRGLPSTGTDEIGYELYVFDPSATDSEKYSLFKEFNTGVSSGYVGDFCELNGKMYFRAYNSDNGDDVLWESDGTAANTTKVTAIENYNIKGDVYAWNNGIYFLADDSTSIENIFVYYPTTGNVTQLTWFTEDHNARHYIEVGNYLYYRGQNEESRAISSSDYRLYRIDGADGTTIELVDTSNTVDIDWLVKVTDPSDNDIILMRGDDDGDVNITGTELYWLNPADITYSEVLSIAKPLSELARVYPNPTTDYLMVPNKLMNASYIIYDITGKVAQQGVIETERVDLNLNQGMYLFEVTLDSGIYTHKLLVK
ncbi:T9SS type A sorting domain-containing protein [Mangrovimonas xylaniphaga]|uniref:T9SS type A sorting domain-containing protein n=1 Tax=Mangrovimonas xylaniphaga TaxID=1645915 RepID=UPI0006B3F93D|nr:T9SS type A sorting domain-containing protein [Mangrovimonas xylaniphaga]